jgi:radical SAM-linked protein
MHRLRVKFKRGPEVKFISHLDLIRLWQRAAHRAMIPLAYSEGFSPHPRISLAAPLATGITSEAELMDIYLSKFTSPHFFTNALGQQLPAGIDIIQVYPIAAGQASLQSKVRFAEYQVTVATEQDEPDIEAAIERLLTTEQLPWQHHRDTGPRNYDLRALIDDLWLIGEPQACTIGMRLRCDSGGSGRPEQVSLALGFERHPRSIHRTKLILETN